MLCVALPQLCFHTAICTHVCRYIPSPKRTLLCLALRVIIGDKPSPFNVHKTVKKPFVVYADFEAANVKVDHDGSGGNTTKLTVHQATSYAMCVVSYDGTSRLHHHTAQDPVSLITHFMNSLFCEARKAMEVLLSTHMPMQLTAEETARHESTRACYACGGAFSTTDPADCKVADHDHLTGRYRGAAHCRCNLRMREDRYVLPCLFHNLKNYDAHHLLRHVSDFCTMHKGVTLNAIPLNKEKLITFSISLPYTTRSGRSSRIRVEFLDSLQFLPSSLDALVQSLKCHGAHKFVHTQQHVNSLVQQGAKPPTDGAQLLQLVTRKGIFPYDWFDGLDKLQATELPPPEAFHSVLAGGGVSDAQYADAQRVWQAFGCTTFADYLHVYMQTDVLLLADVFECFREFSLQHLGLDPCRYYTLPGLGFDALLKMTRAELLLLTEEDMLVFVERGIRGGVSMISHRAAQANNPYMGPELYDAHKETSYITYLDANSLYAWAMQQPLPTHGFKWVDPQELGGVDGVLRLLADTPDDGPTGYFLQVDLEYPHDLHAAHNDLPFAPERMCVNEDMLSPHNRQYLQQFADGHYSDEQKLVPNLQPKSGYVVHARALKQMLRHGLRLTGVTVILQFQQSAWMKPYIDFCVAQRQAAASEFEKDLFKLLMNSVFGKTMENVRRRTHLRLFTNANKAALVKKMSGPWVRGVSIISPCMVAVESHKTRVHLDKPIFVGAAVLDISKTLVYDFHYGYMLAKYGHERCRLLFTDTDSLCYHVHTEDVYRDMAAERGRFDLSAYPSTHWLHDATHAKVAGRFKDETNGCPIVEYVGLKPKLYAYRTLRLAGDGRQRLVECKRAKGVARAALAHALTMDDYAAVLAEGSNLKVDMHAIRAWRHELHTICMNKLALSAFDSKRWVLADGVRTLAYGHHLIPQQHPEAPSGEQDGMDHE